MVEKITETKFTKPNGERVLAEYFLNDDQTVTVNFNGVMDSHMPGSAWLAALETKRREAMNKVQRNLYDFLKARIEQ